MPKNQYTDQGRRLRALARDTSVQFRWTRHALEEMNSDNITRNDVRTVLRKGLVIRVESNRYEETWNCLGIDLDERKIEIVVVANENELSIKVITVWKK
jgi:hypothetical protein